MQAFTSKLTASILAASALAGFLLAPGCAGPGANDQGAIGRQEETLRQTMRKLWEDHITWTRLVIVSTAAGLPDLDATTQRLLQNQTDIGNAMKPFYGDSAGSKLTELLREHIIGAANILAAAKGSDATALDSAKKAWYSNADEVAGFLAGANPNAWPLADAQSMMREHLDLTLAEAVDQLQGRYPESVADYDKVHDAILGMADMLSDGIVKQFPKKFQ
jgi:hypothetical protein